MLSDKASVEESGTLCLGTFYLWLRVYVRFQLLLISDFLHNLTQIGNQIADMRPVIIIFARSRSFGSKMLLAVGTDGGGTSRSARAVRRPLAGNQ